MKEATGEANMTVITIVLITAVAAVATPLIRNILKGNSEKACCTSYGGYIDKATGQCTGASAGYEDCVSETKKQANN